MTMNESPGNGTFSGVFGQRIPPEPGGFGNFILLDFQFSACVIDQIGYHKLVRERPALAAEISYIAYLQPGFLSHFTSEGVLERLAGLDKTGQAAPELLIALYVPEQKDFVTFLDDCDDAGVDAWIEYLAAVRTYQRVFPVVRDKFFPAGRTELRILEPVGISHHSGCGGIFFIIVSCEIIPHRNEPVAGGRCEPCIRSDCGATGDAVGEVRREAVLAYRGEFFVHQNLPSPENECAAGRGIRFFENKSHSLS